MQCPNDSTKSQHKRCSSDEAHNERIYTGKIYTGNSGVPHAVCTEQRD